MNQFVFATRFTVERLWPAFLRVVSTACTALEIKCRREADAALECWWHSLSG